jgi:alpha-galactosidase
MLLVLLILHVATALNNGLGRTPQLGFNSWNSFQCAVTEDDMKRAADAMVDLGLAALGYEYVNLDDCWAKSRDANGVIQSDPETFPSGMAALADYIHSKGLKFGLYTDRGVLTCAKRPGSHGHEVIDAQTYANWGVDYLKEDSCYSHYSDEDLAFEEYAKMRDALNATGRPIFFSLCGWRDWYAPQGAGLGNSWRIAQDDRTWTTVLNSINKNVNLTDFAGPGGWNDPDMLIGAGYYSISEEQSRTQFSMWAVMASPLLIGANIFNMSAYTLETYSNAEVIAVDQDPLGQQGSRIVGENLFNNNRSFNIWSRPLVDGSVAVVFLNNEAHDGTLHCDQHCFKKMGLSSGSLAVRDLWAHKDLTPISAPFSYSVSVPGLGSSVMLKFTPIPSKPSMTRLATA